MMASEVLTFKGLITEGRHLLYASYHSPPHCRTVVAELLLDCARCRAFSKGFSLLDIYLLMNVITTTSTFPLLAGGWA